MIHNPSLHMARANTWITEIISIVAAVREWAVKEVVMNVNTPKITDEIWHCACE
jgi:hypothetical protein